MPIAKPSHVQPRRVVHQRIIISAAAASKVQKLARRFRYRRNQTGSVIDLLIDSMVVAGMALPDGKRAPARLDAEEVRAIRSSKDKISSIAAQYKISEAMTCKVRARASYRWVD